MRLGSLRWLNEGTKGGQIHSVYSVSHPVRDRPANRHCKFLHLIFFIVRTSINLIGISVWQTQDPQGNPTPESKILVVTFKASEIKRFLWDFF